MRAILKYILIACPLLLLSSPLLSQGQKSKKDSVPSYDRGWFVQIPLLSFIQNNYRLELDKKFNKGKNSCYFSAGIYNGFGLNNVRRKTYEYQQDLPNDVGDDRIKGFNAGFGIRYFLPDLSTPKEEDHIFPYIGLEFMHRNVNVFYTEYIWSSYAENGLTYYYFDKKPLKGNIQRTSYTFLLGVQSRKDRWSYDISGGLSLNTARTNRQLEHDRDYNIYSWDYGWNGRNFYLSVKFGYQICK
jgi:hypothetical protein